MIISDAHALSSLHMLLNSQLVCGNISGSNVMHVTSL
jgi:hypothetical protein